MSAAIEAAPTKNERPSGGKRYWPQIATSVFVPVLLLGVIEGALRLFGVGFPTDLTVPCTVQGHAAACYNLFFPAPFFPPGMIKTPQAYAIPAEKPQGTFRIFVLGESAAMGDPDPAYAFSRYLEVMLRERYPSMKFEVVNTGSVAINSHVLLPIAEGLSKQRPDVFIIYSGNNEVVGPYGPGHCADVFRHEPSGHPHQHLRPLHPHWPTSDQGRNSEEGMGWDGDVSRQTGAGEFAAHALFV